MKTYILGLVVAVNLFGCDSKEKLALQHKVDSLYVELVEIKEIERGFNEVGVLIDSIDASRQFLQVKMIEGNNYADYITRLQGINQYIKKTEAKLKALEASNKNTSKTAASSIRRLRADLEKNIFLRNLKFILKRQKGRKRLTKQSAQPRLRLLPK